MIEYESDQGLQATVNELLNFDEFGPLNDNDINVNSILKISLDKHGEPKPVKGPVSSLVKFNDMVMAFAREGASRYTVVVDGYFWIHAEADKKKAAVHKALMQIEVTPSVDGLKFKKRKPDLVEFNATIKRFKGATGERVCELMQIMRAAIDSAEDLNIE